MSKKPLTLVTALATCFPLGQMPKAPGTWGSLPGLGLGWLIYELSLVFQDAYPPWMTSTLVLFICSVFAFGVIDKTEKLWQTHDDKSIVIDEVVGQALPLAFFPFSWELVIVGFLLFRLFDITKPLFVGWADKKVHGALGTLLDDLLAGLIVLAIFIVDYFWLGMMF